MTTTTRSLRPLLGLLLLPLAAPAVRAQSPNPPPALATAPRDQTVTLDPFEVKTGRDTSYGALNSNSITRFNTELDKVPISADIFTQQFMDDVDTSSVNDMLQQYGAGMGMVYASPSSDSNLTQAGDRPLYGDRFTPPQIGVRGLSAGNIRRDGFTSVGTNTSSTSNFDIERVEVLRGPQGLLYGAGGAGGTIVITSKQAQFDRQTGRLYEKVDEYGSKNTQLDFNAGNDWAAARVAVIRNDYQTRRLFIGDLTEGYYAQLAFRLPLHTTLRVEGEYTWDRRLQPQGINVNFGSATADPRNGDSLAYLIATNQTGAINPATGQPFSSFGAIDNGRLTWNNYASFGGWHAEDDFRNSTYQITADTVWTPWLSTTMGANFNHSTDFGNTTGTNVSALTAPGVGGNPFNTWAVSSAMQDTTNTIEHRAARISALLTKNFFNDRAKTQTVLGYDYEFTGQGPDDFAYYQSDASGNIIVSPSVTTNLGRTVIPAQWWSVDGGPVRNALTPLGAKVIVGQDGKYYARAEQNPKNPAWISPTNPFGTASLQPAPANAGVGGINGSDYQFFRHWTNAYYAANYTEWWGDRISTLAGVRSTNTTTPIGSGGNLGTKPQSNTSVNLGLDGKILSWLRWYGSYSSTYNDSQGFNDPTGDLPPTSHAKGEEVGLKFTPMDSKISGSLDYYYTKAYQQNTSFAVTGSNFYEQVNPTGILSTNVYRGPTGAGRNNWYPLDQKSSGVELIVTANPVRNWRIRFSATRSDGRILQDYKAQFIYNDQFYTDSKGGVTYKDGSPFLVPVDASLVKNVTKNTDPATILTPGVATVQLTTAMIGDKTSPYYAWAGNALGSDGYPVANVNGQINNGRNGLPAAPVGNALQYFLKPGVGTAVTGVVGLPITAIQYAWPDPGHTGGFFTVAQAGDLTVGYPVYRLSLVNSYEIDRGLFKGLGAVLAVNNAWQYRTYYYNDPSGRHFFSAPEEGWQINLNPYYTRKLWHGRIVWRTQVDITNLFNHYKVYLTPNNGLGFTRATNIGVARPVEPRLYAWTNSFSF